MGSVTDDGLPDPPGEWTAKWTQTSGPQDANGTQLKATFLSPTAATSEVKLPPLSGAYTFKLTATDGQKSASDTVKITRVDRYTVELKAWIPHYQVVDPLHPVKNTETSTIPMHQDSCWYDSWIARVMLAPLDPCRGSPYSGTPFPEHYNHISYFNGNDHRPYDGNPKDPYKGRVFAEFHWDGKTMTNKVAMARNAPGSIGHTERRFNLVDRDTGSFFLRIEDSQETKDLYSNFPGWPASNEAYLYMRSQNPKFKLHESFPSEYAPPIDARLKVGMFEGEAFVYGYEDDFPSHGYRIYKNGKAMFTHRTVDAWCTPVRGWTGAWAVFNGLRTPPDTTPRFYRSIRTDLTVHTTVSPNCTP